MRYVVMQLEEYSEKGNDFSGVLINDASSKKDAMEKLHTFFTENGYPLIESNDDFITIGYVHSKIRYSVRQVIQTI